MNALNETPSKNVNNGECKDSVKISEDSVEQKESDVN